MRALTFLFLLIPVAVSAQISLQKCLPAAVKHDCVGELVMADGTKYVGEFKAGKRHGRGTEFGHNGVAHRFGLWVDGNFVGAETFPPCTRTGDSSKTCWGRLARKNGTIYLGDILEKRAAGRGTLIFQDGSRWVGWFVNDEFHGLGVEYTSSGAVRRVGTWLSNKLQTSHPLHLPDFPFIGSREAEAATDFAFEDALSRKDNSQTPWKEKLDKIVREELMRWLIGVENKKFDEIAPPDFPAALLLRQEAWETDKEFEERVQAARDERKTTIERIQSEYRNRVEDRNRRVSEYVQERREREYKLSDKRRQLILKGIEIINPTISISDIAFDQKSGDLTLFLTIEEIGKQGFSIAGASQVFRRAVLTDPKGLKAEPEFQVSDSGEIAVPSVKIFAANTHAIGTPTFADVPQLQLAGVTLDQTSVQTFTQQSPLTVDRNQVEQILYREENELLRKRLQEQRRQQEQALALAESRAAAEATRLRAEAEALKKQLALSDARPAVGSALELDAHALVIGNSSYAGSGRLANPTNDAKAISNKLRSLGFKVTEITNTNREQMVRGLSDFSKSAARADLSLLFYAGHGVQISGVNYMIPVDMNLSDATQATLQAVSLNSVIEQYMPGKAKLVFLDACRDNPLMASAGRGVTRGLAPINASEGTLIAYATKDGQTAEDGVGMNSPFTAALLEYLDDPQDIAVVLRKVREKVVARTNGRQQPWEYGSLTGGALVLSAIKPRQ